MSNDMDAKQNLSPVWSRIFSIEVDHGEDVSWLMSMGINTWILHVVLE